MTHRKLYLSLTLCLCLTSPLLQAKEGELPPDPQVEALLDRFVGRWVGLYRITTLDGQVLQEMETEIIYRWKDTSEGRVLIGRAVYASAAGIGHSESETFVANNLLFSTVEQIGKIRVYRGRLGRDGNSVVWTPVDTESTLDESLRQTFGSDPSGKDTLITTGYENLIRDDAELMLTIHGTLIRTPLEEPAAKPVLNY